MDFYSFFHCNGLWSKIYLTLDVLLFLSVSACYPILIFLVFWLFILLVYNYWHAAHINEVLIGIGILSCHFIHKVMPCHTWGFSNFLFFLSWTIVFFTFWVLLFLLVFQISWDLIRFWIISWAFLSIKHHLVLIHLLFSQPLQFFWINVFKLFICIIILIFIFLAIFIIKVIVFKIKIIHGLLCNHLTLNLCHRMRVFGLLCCLLC